MEVRNQAAGEPVYPWAGPVVIGDTFTSKDGIRVLVLYGAAHETYEELEKASSRMRALRRAKERRHMHREKH